MKISRMKCNRMDSPIGFDIGNPRLSWVYEDIRPDEKASARIIVSESDEFDNLWYDSGFLDEYDSGCFVIDKKTQGGKRYFWKVIVSSDNNSTQSDVAWFETGKPEGKWKAKWIKPDFNDKNILPLIRREISIDKNIESARAYICGLGLYEMEINGKSFQDEYFTPGCNAYDKWIQYQTYDITDYISKGKNCIGAMLGTGWYKGRFSFAEDTYSIYGDEFAFLCEIHITYTDGSKEIVCTDNSWEAAPSFILDGNIYDGEIQDASKKIPGWSKPGNPPGFIPVKYADIDYSLLMPRKSVPVRIMERIKPVKLITTPSGDKVLDFGQNMVGWIEFRLDDSEIKKVQINVCEALENGEFYTDNYRSAKSEFIYISDGSKAFVRPHFTFYGFRYARIQGWKKDPDPDAFTGCVIYSDLEMTGNVETSNPLVNRLFLNALWGQKGNFLDVPTDCPQRDERLGWTGDVLSFSGAGCFNMDCDAFYHKFLFDLHQEQIERKGGVPPFVPMFKSDIVNGIRFEESMFTPPGACGWGDAATVVPWNTYIHYGDKHILESQFESMKAWVDAIKRYDTGNRLWDSGFHFGDWLSLDVCDLSDPHGGTSTVFLASCFYAYSSILVSKAAGVLGYEDLRKEYKYLSEEIKSAIRNEFLTPAGRLSIDTQTAYCYMLFLDIAPDFKKRLAGDLVKNIEKNKGHLQTGFLGTQILCRVLSDNGYNNIAYKLLLNEDYPGWLYSVKMGATTIWERWNSILPDGTFNPEGMNSLNHYSYGSVAEWMYRNMCGINPDEENPGFRHIILSPQPDPSLEWAKACLKSPYGDIESGWKYSSNELEYEFTIPWGCSAKIKIPYAEKDTPVIKEDTSGIINPDIKIHDDKICFYLKAGKYSVKSAK